MVSNPKIEKTTNEDLVAQMGCLKEEYEIVSKKIEQLKFKNIDLRLNLLEDKLDFLIKRYSYVI